MRDTQKPLRAAVYQALGGNVNVGGVIPVFDEKKSVTSSAKLYILLSTQQEVNSDTMDTFMTQSFLDIEVCQQSGSEVSKDDIDDVSDAVYAILFPSPYQSGLTNPSLMQIQNLRREKTITRALEISATESILRKIITVSALIIQQS